MVNKNQRYNHWEVLEILDDTRCIAKCDCGTVKEVTIYNIEHGRSKSCGCTRNRKESIENKTFGEWTVLKDLKNGKCLCRCSCEEVRTVYKSNLVRGLSKSCGHLDRVDTANQTFGEWKVLKELGYGKVLCECSCGTIKELYKKAVINGETKSCGCKGIGRNRLEGQQFGYWTVKRYIGNSFYECECICKKLSKVSRNALLSGLSKSCGCQQGKNIKATMLERYNETCSAKINNPREDWQIKAVESRENMLKFLTYINYTPTVAELTSMLNINASTVLLKIHEYELENYVSISKGSKDEEEILQIVRNFTDKEILRNDRNAINPYELDIYIPELRIAIEFNGNYWHSNIFKESNYHQKKVLQCIKNNIHLVSIFEYEWDDDVKKEKIIQYLKSILCKNNVIYARDTKVIEISGDRAYEFENVNHLQGSAHSSVNVALTYNNEIVGLMTFGKPRFNSEYQYELIRLCFKSDITVVGGANKMLKHFIREYNPDSIISYCNLSKFTGKVYSELGFKISELTKPNYVWFDTHSRKYYSRYQTMKSDLISRGIGTIEQTEDDIMEEIQCIKIYDCGNIKFIWNKQ